MLTERRAKKFDSQNCERVRGDMLSCSEQLEYNITNNRALGYLSPPGSDYAKLVSTLNVLTRHVPRWDLFVVLE